MRKEEIKRLEVSLSANSGVYVKHDSVKRNSTRDSVSKTGENETEITVLSVQISPGV